MDILRKNEEKSRNVNANTTDTFFSFLIPIKAKMVLTHFGNYTEEPEAWGSVTWSVRRNGIGVFPLDSIKDAYGLTSQPVQINPVDFAGGDLFEVIIINNFPAQIAIGAAIRYEFIGEDRPVKKEEEKKDLLSVILTKILGDWINE